MCELARKFITEEFEKGDAIYVEYSEASRKAA